MTIISAQLRISLSVASFLSAIGLPVLYIFNNAMGVFMTVCFSMTSFCVFYVFALLPVQLNNRIRSIEDKHYPISPKLVSVQKETTAASARYDTYTNVLIGIGVTFFVIGVIGFVAAH